MLDRVKTIRDFDKDILSRLPPAVVDKLTPEEIKSLKSGDVAKVLGNRKITAEDLQNFLGSQYVEFKATVIQEQPNTSQYASYYEPNLSHVAAYDSGSSLSDNDRQFLAMSMAKNIEFKAAEGDKKDETETPYTRQELLDQAGDLRGDFDTVLSELTDMQFNQQLADAENLNDEIKREVQKIAAMVRSGQLGPEFALIALAKVISTRSGMLVSAFGQRTYQLNEDARKIGESLYNSSSLGDMQKAKTELDWINKRMQLEGMTPMQKAMSHIENAISLASNMLGEFSKHKQQMSQALAGLR